MNKYTKSFQSQIKKGFITVVVIPVLVLSVFFMYYSTKYIENKNNLEVYSLINQNSLDIENKLKTCDNSLKYLSANYDFKNFLLINDSNYLQLSQISKSIGILFYNTLISNHYYESLTLYIDKDINLLTDFIKSRESIINEDWYEKVINSEEEYWWYEDNKFFVARKIMSAYPLEPVGIIKAEIKSKLFYDSLHILENIPISININIGDNIIYSYKNSTEDNFKLKKVIPLNIQDLKITYKIDEQYYNNYLFIGLFLPILLIFIVVCLTWILMCNVPKKLVEDLSTLVKEVEAVQKGDLSIKMSSSKIIEINILSEGIQSMLSRISKLIDEIYYKEIERQELEINLLQSKIKPHFLYNNLSAINWIALECEQEKIYTIATELANFYRTALNKGRNVDKIHIEIENIKSYINLQLISHNNSFKVEYDIEEDLLDEYMPIFILQPLVENAIEHGIDLLTNKEGIIKIKFARNNEFLEICVYDNGVYLYEKIGKSILPKESFGYATTNINKRLELLYGEKDALKIYADKIGTRAIIKFKLKKLRKLVI